MMTFLMWMVDLPGARTGLLLAYWNMKVVHDNKTKLCADVQLGDVLRAVTWGYSGVRTSSWSSCTMPFTCRRLSNSGR